MKISDIIEAEEFTPLPPYPDPKSHWSSRSPKDVIKKAPWKPAPYSQKPNDSMMGQYYNSVEKRAERGYVGSSKPRPDSKSSAEFQRKIQRNYTLGTRERYSRKELRNPGEYPGYIQRKQRTDRSVGRVI